MKKTFLFLGALFMAFIAQSQNTSYWQQHVDYTMDIDFDIENYQYDGKQKLVYTNNSPEELNKVYYHLYFNAFQPGSQMDMRLQNIKDPDGRMTNNLGDRENPKYQSRISLLKEDEIGFIKVSSLSQDGTALEYKVEGTVLEVKLAKAIKPGESTTFDMVFKGQVPVQIRRSGRNNKEGVALSMTQWYPKMAEYDFEGWHAHPYVAREFHAVWGDFDVTIHLDERYTIGGTGYLQNPNEIGHGYQDKGVKFKKKTYKKNKNRKLDWHFVAPKVHDFTWAADKDYSHDIVKTSKGTDLHFLYKNNKEIKENWKKLQPSTVKMLEYYNTHIGEYPYKQYSVIQGGDGGMEYAMCTLITGERSEESLMGVTAHELAHTWFQFLLASNESKHPWMDEGFTTYISAYIENDLLGVDPSIDPLEGSYSSYFRLVDAKLEEPMSTHGDRYIYNFAYGVASYSKGSLFLAQLRHIIGKENVDKTILKYFKDFSFKHPTPNDIKRTAEKVSDMELDWYLNEWTQTTHTIDYSVKIADSNNISLSRIGRMPMPIDLSVKYEDGTTEEFHIPLRMARGHKPTKATVLESWAWGNPSYSVKTSKNIVEAHIDVKNYMADINKENNSDTK